MSFPIPQTEAAWGKFVAWSALVLAGASLTAIMFYVFVLGLDDFSPLAELTNGWPQPRRVSARRGSGHAELGGHWRPPAEFGNSLSADRVVG